MGKIWRDEIFQDIYDVGYEGACKKRNVSEERLWEILYPPFPRIDLPRHKTRPIACTGELSDLLSKSYNYLTKVLADGDRNNISQLDSLNDAVAIAINKFGNTVLPTREELRSEITRQYHNIEFYKKLHRSKHEEI